VAGATNLFYNGTVAKFGGYRFHVMDPLVFENGCSMQWRNGDMNDPTTGLKCFTEKGGIIVGHPGPAEVLTYGWVYVWPTKG